MKIKKWSYPDDLTYPIFVYVQGSAWMKQNVYRDLPRWQKSPLLAMLLWLLNTGAATWLPPRSRFLMPKTAVRFMKLHGPEYQGDPKRVILAGNSSGDHTAVYASFFPEGEDNLYPDVNRQSKWRGRLLRLCLRHA